GLALHVGFLLPQRLQLRLQRVLQAPRRRGGTCLLQLWVHQPGPGRSLGRQRLLQNRRGRYLSHLFDLWPRRRRVSRSLPVSRRDAEGARRERAVPEPRRLGPAEEYVRQGWHGRSERTVPRAQLRLRHASVGGPPWGPRDEQ